MLFDRTVRRLFRLPASAHQLRDDVDAEVAFHLDARVHTLVAQGLAPGAARAQAAREFGDVRAARAELHAMSRTRAERARHGELWSGVAHDVRFAARSLRRRPLFLLAAVTTLALGIGASVAIFSVVNGVLLTPLPYAAPGRLVRVWRGGAVPLGIYDIVRERSRSYSALAGAEMPGAVSVTGDLAPARLARARVTPNLFGTLGVRPLVGRTFAEEDRELGRERTVVLSHALWRERYGGDRNVVGRFMTIDGVAHAIVGVMPSSFRYPDGATRLWTVSSAERGTPDYWWMTYMQLVGRLAPGVTPAQAQREAARVFDGARSAFPMRMADEWGRDVDVVSLRDAVIGTSRPTLLLLSAAVGVLLLVACVNVATLYVDRAAARERELAVRASIGAGRGRIARQLLTESLLVASVGAAAGLALAAAGLRGFVALLPPGTPRAEEIGIDVRALGVTVALAVVSGVAFGLLPARRAARQDVHTVLRGGARAGDARGPRRAPRVLAVAQIGLAVVLVASAGLLLKSFWRLRQVELGFGAERVLTAEVPAPAVTSDTTARVRAFYTQVLERVEHLPGVRSAALTNGLPFGGGAYMTAMAVEDHPTADGAPPPLPIVTWATSDYLRTLGVPLRRGRALATTDGEGTPRVAVIDDEAARTLWPGENPIGRRIRYVWNQQWIEVVGVVGTVRRDSLSAALQPSLYVPLSQAPLPATLRVVVRADASLDAAAFGRALRAAVAATDASVPVGPITSLDRAVSTSAARPRFTAALIAAFAVAALALGAVGIYGVVAAGVARRRREFGVRIALGATAAQVVRLVVREGAAVTALGVLFGLVGTLAAGRLLRGLLFAVGPTDPVVLLAVPVLLGAVAMLASLVPARRAARVDPSTVIRAD